VQHVRARYGGPLDWPLASPYLFDREKVGGGALIDQGVHLLDALLWVMDAAGASVEEAAHDGDSGVEAEVRARLRLQCAGGRADIPCQIEVSRVRRMANRIDVAGERASLTIPLSSALMPQWQGNGAPQPAVGPDVTPLTGTRCFAEQLDAFARRVRGLEAECAEAESQLRVLELIEACYRARQPLVHPWEAYDPWPDR
jgi:predicted dehydrogenase